MSIKNITVLIAITATVFAPRFFYAQVRTASNPLNGDVTKSRAVQEQQALYEQQALQNRAQAEILAAQQAEVTLIYAKDTWRAIGDSTNLARGDGWLEFQGEVQEPLPTGVVLKGKFGPILTIHAVPDSTIAGIKYIYGDDLFFVESFPYPSISGRGYQQMMAKDGDYFSYTNSTGQLITIRRLIYGKPCQKIWSPEEIAAAKQKVESKKQAATDKVVKYYQDLADKNDPVGLLRMGQRYRDGDGVPKDLTKARSCLSKAADAGSPTAADELKHFPAN